MQRKQLNNMRIIPPILAMILSSMASDASTYYTAPCTTTYNDPFPPPLAMCTATITETAPIVVTHPRTEYSGIYDACNIGMTCPVPENTPAPCQLFIFSTQTYSEIKYALGGSADWQVFGLSASCSTNQTTATQLLISNNLCGWCACASADIAQQDVTSSVSVTFTPIVDVLYTCEGDEYLLGLPCTMTLDTYTLTYLTPALIHQANPPVGCKTSCP